MENFRLDIFYGPYNSGAAAGSIHLGIFSFPLFHSIVSAVQNEWGASHSSHLGPIKVDPIILDMQSGRPNQPTLG